MAETKAAPTEISFLGILVRAKGVLPKDTAHRILARITQILNATEEGKSGKTLAETFKLQGVSVEMIDIVGKQLSTFRSRNFKSEDGLRITHVTDALSNARAILSGPDQVPPEFLTYGRSTDIVVTGTDRRPNRLRPNKKP